MGRIGAGVFISVGLLAVVFVLLSAPAFQASAARGSSVGQGDLPEALQGVDIKDRFLPCSGKESGELSVLRGNAVIVHGDTEEAFFAAEGDPIFEHDSIRTLGGSRCRIRFSTEDVVTMGPESCFSIEEYRDQTEEGKKTSLFSMVTGKIKFYALKLMRYKESTFRVKTPTAVIGVRGTRFIVHVHERRTASGHIRVAVKGDGEAFTAAGSVSGKADVCTDTYIKDGCVEVNGMELCAGEMSLCQGPAEPMPEEVWNKLDCAVDPDMCRKGKKVKEKEGPETPELPESIEEQTERTMEKHHPEKEPGKGSVNQYNQYEVTP